VIPRPRFANATNRPLGDQKIVFNCFLSIDPVLSSRSQVWGGGGITNEFEIVDDSGFCGFFKHVKVDVCAKTHETSFWVNDIGSHHSSKSFPLWFPCKCNDCIFYLDDFNRDILLPDMENFQICKRSLLSFRMSVNLDTQKL